MLKYVFGILVLILLKIKADAQPGTEINVKPVIDTSVFGKWPEILSPSISNDGKYSFYLENHSEQFITNIRNNNIFSTLHIVNNDSLYTKKNANYKEIKIDGVISEPVFSNDNIHVYFMQGKDSLGIIELNTRSVSFVPDVQSFAIAEESDWFAYLGENNQLKLSNAVTGAVCQFERVTNYKFTKDGKKLLLETKTEFESKQGNSLCWVELPSCSITKIWDGKYLNWNSCTFDLFCSKLAFIASSNLGLNVDPVIYCYQEGAQHAENIVNDSSFELEGGFTITDGELKFSRRGDKILFPMKKCLQQDAIPQGNYINVDIWNYKDEYLQSEQLKRSFRDRVTNAQYMAVVNVGNKKIVRLNKDGEEVIIPETFQGYLLVDHSHWYKNYYDDTYAYYVVSVDDGEREFISDKRLTADISPDDLFLVWFDYARHQYFSYEIAVKKKRTITKSIPFSLDLSENISRNNAPFPYGIAGWHPDSHSLFIYDEYDIWKVDLLGGTPPINMTDGFGRRDSVVFDLVAQRFGNHEELLLSGFDLKNKNNGFWKALNGISPLDPTKLYMDACFYTGRITGGEGPGSFQPIKAKHAEQYLIRRQSASDFPNLYLTSDFKNFHAVSKVHPEKTYNWLTSELINWRMTDGKMSQGILYKPENFDPHKRYPVIFQYYVRQSGQLNEYKSPDWSFDIINIPYFVSNGYLIFRPDVYYEPGRNGQSVVNSVVSAAQYLSQLPYVNSTKMGIQGHSFAGWETNYLVTHSRIFAAACAVSGVSDQISNFNELADGSLFPASYLEIINPGNPYGSGITPSTRPDLYEENSPVLAVENVFTPLLIASGDLDRGVPFRQDLEMYLAMRRAHKRVWLLEYEKEGHSIFGNDAKDYTIRVKQFFDYYLKGNLPPVWMTRGRSAALKGINDGLASDTSGAKP